MCERTFVLVVIVGVLVRGGGGNANLMFLRTHTVYAVQTGQWIIFPAYVMERMARLWDKIE